VTAERGGRRQSLLRRRCCRWLKLSEEEIERIVGVVPGGAENIQDYIHLFAVAEGILFHHLMGGKGDAYLLAGLCSFDSRARLDSLRGSAAVGDRAAGHLADGGGVGGFNGAVQVVWRKAVLQWKKLRWMGEREISRAAVRAV